MVCTEQVVAAMRALQIRPAVPMEHVSPLLNHARGKLNAEKLALASRPM